MNLAMDKTLGIAQNRLKWVSSKGNHHLKVWVGVRIISKGKR